MFEYEIVDGEVTITGYKDKTVESIEFPEFIEGYLVTKINGNPFSSIADLSVVQIPKNIKTINSTIFLFNYKLRYINGIELNSVFKIIDERLIYYYNGLFFIDYVICDDCSFRYGRTKDNYIINNEFFKFDFNK